MAGWIPISKVFVSVTTVKIYRLKSKNQANEWVEENIVKSEHAWAGGDSELNSKAAEYLKVVLAESRL